MTKKKKIWMIVAVIILSFVIFEYSSATNREANIFKAFFDRLREIFGSVKQKTVDASQVEIWQKDYRARLPPEVADQKYIEETKMFDYNTPEVKAVAEEIRLQSATPQEAVENTLDWVYKNIPYRQEGNSECYSGTASEVLKRKAGQCDTQSMVVIAVVRSMGIAVKPVGGCIYPTHKCDIRFSFMSTLGVDPRVPKYTTIDLSNPDEIPRAGGLHLWSEYYDVDLQKWVIMEATSGKVVEDPYCFNYEVELEIENNDQKKYCTSDNITFAKMCASR